METLDPVSFKIISSKMIGRASPRVKGSSSSRTGNILVSQSLPLNIKQVFPSWRLPASHSPGTDESQFEAGGHTAEPKVTAALTALPEPWTKRRSSMGRIWPTGAPNYAGTEAASYLEAGGGRLRLQAFVQPRKKTLF